MFLGDLIVFVKDMKNVTAFYVDVLGLELEEEQPFDIKKFVKIKTGQCKLCLHSASKPNEGRHKMVFTVESVKEKYDELKAKKLRLKKLDPPNPEGLAMFQLKDPEGNIIQIWGKY